MLVGEIGHGRDVKMAAYAAAAVPLLLVTGIVRGLLAYGELYVPPPGNMTADGPLPIFSEAPGAFITLAVMLACWQLWQQNRTRPGKDTV